MEITCDTDLSEILNSDDVAEIIQGASRSVRENTSTRMSTLGRQIRSDVIQNSLIDGENIMAPAGTKVSNEFKTFHLSIADYTRGIVTAARNQELDELDKLQQAVETKIRELETKIEHYNIEYSRITITDLPYTATEADLENRKEQIKNNRIKTEREVETYEKKLELIKQRIAEISGGTYTPPEEESAPQEKLINEMPTITVGADGKPTEIPQDFVVDSHHRLDLPGWGILLEATGGNKIEFHYNPERNKFYSSDEGTDWSTFDYDTADEFDDAITVEDMVESAVKGGVCPF